MIDSAATYQVPPFDCSCFSSHELSDPPLMEPLHLERFLHSLEAKSTLELVATARLWEDTLLTVYPTPFFLVRVADVRAALNSNATALDLYKEAQKVIEIDSEFNQFVTDFERKCVAEQENHRTKWSQGIFNQPWLPISKLRFPTIPISPEVTSSLQTRWTGMKSGTGEHMQQYLRYMCIESNTLELNFSLSSRSVTQLVRKGYQEEGVECLNGSAILDRASIIEILRDTQKALEMVLSVSDDPDHFTVELLCDLHKICLKTSRILPFRSNDGQDFEMKYLNPGVTRQKSCKNAIIPGPPRVQFCPFENVMEELRKFTHLARQWLKNWKKNPFATAAWLHLVFVACHPFDDGNGRVARMIASIPLIQAGLPPLCIPNTNNKKSYYEGLHKARENDYEALIRCFVQALNDSVTTIDVLDSIV